MEDHLIRNATEAVEAVHVQLMAEHIIKKENPITVVGKEVVQKAVVVEVDTLNHLAPRDHTPVTRMVSTMVNHQGKEKKSKKSLKPQKMVKKK